MDNTNFSWIVKDIYDSLLINLFYKEEDGRTLCSSYEVASIIAPDGGKVNVGFANIDDITNLLTICSVRFVSVMDNRDIIDIPIRNMYRLYDNATRLGEEGSGLVGLNDLDAFAILDGAMIRDKYLIMPVLVKKVSQELLEIINTSKEFGGLGMQEKFDAISSTNMLNYRKIRDDNK